MIGKIKNLTFLNYHYRRHFKMFKKTKVKQILSLLHVNSPNAVIVEMLHVARKTIIKVNREYLECGKNYEELMEMNDDELYQLFFPNKFLRKSSFIPIDYSYVQSELKRT